MTDKRFFNFTYREDEGISYEEALKNMKKYSRDPFSNGQGVYELKAFANPIQPEIEITEL